MNPYFLSIVVTACGFAYAVSIGDKDAAVICGLAFAAVTGIYRGMRKPR